MKFTLTTDKGSFVSIPVETLTLLQEYFGLSGYMLSVLQDHPFDDKVLTEIVQMNVKFYNEIYNRLSKPLTKDEESTEVIIEMEEVQEEIIPSDNVIQFPFGKK
jgi:hypothetical protein